MISIFHPELQLKNTDSLIKKKLKNSLNEIKRFKFFYNFGLEVKKKQTKMKQSIASFIWT